jgi:hypothetical protein
MGKKGYKVQVSGSTNFRCGQKRDVSREGAGNYARGGRAPQGTRCANSVTHFFEYFSKVQFLQTSLLNLCILGGVIFCLCMINSNLCDLEFFGDGACFYSPGE